MVQVVAAHDVAQHQHARQHGQTACAGDGERHACATPRVLAVVPVADQQEGEQAGQLPEERDLDDVAREHYARHRAHEGQEEREEARHRVGRRHVVARVQHHQAAHTQHQHAEHPRKAIHADHEVQAQRGQPGQLLPDHAAVRNLREVERRLDRAEHGNKACQGGLGIAGVGRQNRCQQAADEGEKDEGDQGHAQMILGRVPLQFPHALAVQCGWMREGGRSQ